MFVTALHVVAAVVLLAGCAWFAHVAERSTHGTAAPESDRQSPPAPTRSADRRNEPGSSGLPAESRSEAERHSPRSTMVAVSARAT
jgi:hypothetical protein